MSEIPIDEDKITILRDKIAKKVDALKEEYQDLVQLHNQLSGISKNKKGELPISTLTKKELTPELRKIIYKECMESCTRLKLN